MTHLECVPVTDVALLPLLCGHTGSQTLCGKVGAPAWPPAGSYTAAGPRNKHG